LFIKEEIEVEVAGIIGTTPTISSITMFSTLLLVSTVVGRQKEDNVEDNELLLKRNIRNVVNVKIIIRNII